MATMATSHSLSVLTNASVKPPINPETGLSTSFTERPDTFQGRLSQVYYDDYDNDHLDGDEVLEFGTRRMGNDFDARALQQLGNLSDEEFYQKLLRLKSEQKKILHKCERLYIEKHQGEDDVQPCGTRYSLNGDLEGTLDDYYKDRIESDIASRRSVSPAPRDGGTTPPLPESPPRDNVRDLYTKPPSGRNPSPLVAKSLNFPPARPNSAPLGRPEWSLEDFRHTALGLRRSIEKGKDDTYLPDDTMSEPYRTKDMSFAMSHIDDMWDNFSIEDYAPRERQRRASAGSSRRKEEKKTDEWRHRLTVPKPFTMTLRESNKEKPKSLTMMEFERQQIEKEREEENECQKKFKASPVPAHVYLPLFDEISEKSEERRRYIKQCSEDILKSQQKPFSFTKREEDRKMHQRFDRECNEPKPEKPKEATIKKNGFKAKPVPKYLFDSSVDERQMEEEEYRKIRMKMRAKELMRSASLPPNMEAREKMIEQKKQEMAAKTKKRRRHHQKPKASHEVPDYGALYRQFQQELQRRKASNEATVTHPFRLETKRAASIKQKSRPNTSQDDDSLRDSRWPYSSTDSKNYKLGHISVSLDSLPAKSTRSFDARTNQTKAKLNQLTEREQQEIEEERRRRVREMKLRRHIQERTPKATPRESYEEKKRRIRTEEKTRREEYERELAEIKDRVNRRPLLFEQETQTNAKKSAEKKFNATLKSVGLDEEFINSRGSRTASVQDYTDDYDDEFDETYVKDRDERRSASPEA